MVLETFKWKPSLLFFNHGNIVKYTALVGRSVLPNRFISPSQVLEKCSSLARFGSTNCSSATILFCLELHKQLILLTCSIGNREKIGFQLFICRGRSCKYKICNTGQVFFEELQFNRPQFATKGV
jgi:hypothetical protein